MTGLADTPGSSVPMPSPRPASSQLLSNVKAAALEFRRLVASLTDTDVRAPSRLPGWSRGHVLAHVSGVADAMARQLEYAARGETIDLYDGGSDGRNRAIEEGSVRSADRLRVELDAALDRALTAFRDLRDEDWHAPISYRGGVVRDGGFAMWRELVIHGTDLGTGSEADAWPPQFCEHLFGFLSARIPAGLRLRVQPFGMAPRVLGASPEAAVSSNSVSLNSVSSNTVSVSTASPNTASVNSARVHTISVNGMATDIAAWLAGRTPNLGSLRAEAAADGVDLPKLLPWPAGIPAK